MKRKVYIAERIREGTPSVPIHRSMTVEQVKMAYSSLTVEAANYVHNGHWMLRGPKKEGAFPTKQIPDCIEPFHIWEMCKEKIDGSDSFVAVVGLESYGCVAEAGYAVGRGKAVYVLAEKETPELFKEVWFLFNMSLTTKLLWNEMDLNVEAFKERGITTLNEYEQYVRNIIPPFLT